MLEPFGINITRLLWRSWFRLRGEHAAPLPDHIDFVIVQGPREEGVLPLHKPAAMLLPSSPVTRSVNPTHVAVRRQNDQT